MAMLCPELTLIVYSAYCLIMLNFLKYHWPYLLCHSWWKGLHWQRSMLEAKFVLVKNIFMGKKVQQFFGVNSFTTSCGVNWANFWLVEMKQLPVLWVKFFLWSSTVDNPLLILSFESSSQFLCQEGFKKLYMLHFVSSKYNLECI